MDSVVIRKTLTSTHIIASPSFQRSPNLLHFPISIGMHRISQPQYYWHFRSEILSFWVRVSGSYAWQHASVYPLDANAISSVVTTENVFRYCQMCPWGKISPAEFLLCLRINGRRAAGGKYKSNKRRERRKKGRERKEGSQKILQKMFFCYISATGD